MGSLLLLGFVLPIFGVYFMVYLLKKMRPLHKKDIALSIIRPLFFIVECAELNVCVTLLLKKYSGRQRPDFFALCDYKGYRNAISGDAGAMENYLNTTTFGAIAMENYLNTTTFG